MHPQHRTASPANQEVFVQASVLSGCDYTPNRLAGVGPVTSFRMVKGHSHREDGERFGRVLRGVRIVPPADIEEGDNGNVRKEKKEEDDGDCDVVGGSGWRRNLRQAAERASNDYEALLAKSEAVFYYHFFEVAVDGSIIPFVEPPKPELESEAKSDDRRGLKIVQLRNRIGTKTKTKTKVVAQKEKCNEIHSQKQVGHINITL